MCLAGVGDAVVELGDVAAAQRGAELLEAARALRDGDGEHRLAMLAELGLLGDEAQPVEVGVGARGDRDQRLAARAIALDPRLGAGDAQRPRRLEHHARILEDVLDRGADLVGVDQHHVVDQRAADAEGFAADLLHRDAVGKETDVIELDAPARLQ